MIYIYICIYIYIWVSLKKNAQIYVLKDFVSIGLTVMVPWGVTPPPPSFFLPKTLFAHKIWSRTHKNCVKWVKIVLRRLKITCFSTFSVLALAKSHPWGLVIVQWDVVFWCFWYFILRYMQILIVVFEVALNSLNYNTASTENVPDVARFSTDSKP